MNDPIKGDRVLVDHSDGEYEGVVHDTYMDDDDHTALVDPDNSDIMRDVPFWAMEVIG